MEAAGYLLALRQDLMVEGGSPSRDTTRLPQRRCFQGCVSGEGYRGDGGGGSMGCGPVLSPARRGGGVARSVSGSGSSVCAGGKVVALAWDGAVSTLESLLCDPNPNSPANSEAARMFSENKREYNRKVREIVEQSWTAD
ncbi:hypothetical protein D1007_43411 [Hordeum vulgare]|nr:hypothetical protein D1007_43411 [Hordeum vulgare]